MIKLKGDGFEYKGGSRFKHKNGGGGGYYKCLVKGVDLFTRVWKGEGKHKGWGRGRDLNARVGSLG